jgi:hypothetical protein
MLEIQKAKSKMMIKMYCSPKNVNKCITYRQAILTVAYCAGRTWPAIVQVGDCPTAPIV